MGTSISSESMLRALTNPDGLNFARAVRKAVCNGKQVVVYKAGRTAAGAIAALGHTASETGDYQLCKTILTQAGAMLADSFPSLMTCFISLIGYTGK